MTFRIITPQEELRNTWEGLQESPSNVLDIQGPVCTVSVEHGTQSVNPERDSYVRPLCLCVYLQSDAGGWRGSRECVVA